MQQQVMFFCYVMEETQLKRYAKKCYGKAG